MFKFAFIRINEPDVEFVCPKLNKPNVARTNVMEINGNL